MDEVERVAEVGQQIAALAHGPLGPVTTSGRVHVDNVAKCIASDSAEYMETDSQRLVRYRNAQMCEVSDMDEWMELHHGMSDDEESEDP